MDLDEVSDTSLSDDGEIKADADAAEQLESSAAPSSIELDDISDASIDGVDNGAVIDNNDSGNASGSAQTAASMCYPCRLVFTSRELHQQHRYSLNHLRLVAYNEKPTLEGQNPEAYCLLCWLAFADRAALDVHEESHAHIDNAKQNGVESIFRDIPRIVRRATYLPVPAPAPPAKRKLSPPPLKKKKKANVVQSRQYRPALTKSVPPAPVISLPQFHCVECNLAFVSGRSERLHRESERHLAVFDGATPSDHKYACLLCWDGFETRANIIDHYNGDEHVNRMKKYGILKLLLDERENVEDAGGPPGDLADCIVLDEVTAEVTAEEERAAQGKRLEPAPAPVVSKGEETKRRKAMKRRQKRLEARAHPVQVKKKKKSKVAQKQRKKAARIAASIAAHSNYQPKRPQRPTTIPAAASLLDQVEDVSEDEVQVIDVH